MDASPPLPTVADPTVIAMSPPLPEVAAPEEMSMFPEEPPDAIPEDSVTSPDASLAAVFKFKTPDAAELAEVAPDVISMFPVSYTHLTLPTIYSV